MNVCGNQLDYCKTVQVLWKVLDEKKYPRERLILHNCYIFFVWSNALGLEMLEWSSNRLRKAAEVQCPCAIKELAKTIVCYDLDLWNNLVAPNNRSRAASGVYIQHIYHYLFSLYPGADAAGPCSATFSQADKNFSSLVCRWERFDWGGKTGPMLFPGVLSSSLLSLSPLLFLLANSSPWTFLCWCGYIPLSPSPFSEFLQVSVFSLSQSHPYETPTSAGQKFTVSHCATQATQDIEHFILALKHCMSPLSHN